MSDVIRVERGAPPWRPSSGALLVAVFNEYDVPLLGIVEQHACNYLFDCRYGHVEGLSVWSYHLVESDEAEDMIAAESAEFDRLRKSIESRAPMLLTMAIGDLGIVASSVVQEVTQDEINSALNELQESYSQWREQLSEHRGEADELRSAHDLISA